MLRKADPEAVIKRCAIYTRKSSAEGLDQPVNSLDAQRHLCESFIASQAGEGWVTLPERFDDGGFSGGSLDRPALRRLMERVLAGTIDAVIVYKIDRLSRSLVDFVSLLNRFDQRGVSFVAVTQAFNTTSSMGRLTLNVLLSFAQFEREMLSERLRDKFAAVRAQGLWQTGHRPFGYHLEDHRLRPHEVEAKAVRHAYRTYPKIMAARLLAADMAARGMFNKAGRPFGTSHLLRLLVNRLYRGELVYNGRSVPGAHEPIISETEWSRVQNALRSVARIYRPGTLPTVPNPLRGRIFLSNQPLSHTFSRHGDRIHRYYTPGGERRYHHGDHYRAADFDAGVLAVVRAYGEMLGIDAESSTEPELLERLVERVDIDGDAMRIRLKNGMVLRALVAGKLETSW